MRAVLASDIELNRTARRSINMSDNDHLRLCVGMDRGPGADAQRDTLKAAGVAVLFEEKARDRIAHTSRAC